MGNAYRGLGVAYYPEHWDRALWEDDVARMLDVSGIGSRVGGFLPSKDALAAMIRSCASPKKRYTIIRYLNDRGLLDDAVAYVAKNMQQ